MKLNEVELLAVKVTVTSPTVTTTFVKSDPEIVTAAPLLYSKVAGTVTLLVTEAS